MPGRKKTIKKEEAGVKKVKRGRGRPRKNAVKVVVAKKTSHRKTHKDNTVVLKKTEHDFRDEIIDVKKTQQSLSQGIYEQSERQREMMMWVGVIFFMIVIGGFWIYNTKQIFEKNKIEAQANDFSFSQWDELTKDISEKMGQFKDELGSLKATSTADITTTTGENTVETGTSTKNIEAQDEVVEVLQERLIASSTEDGEVLGVFEEVDIIEKLKTKLEK